MSLLFPGLSPLPESLFSLSWSVHAFFRYLMLCCLLIFICEAFESCLGSRVQRQQRAGMSGSVRSFTVGRWCPHAAASALPTRCCFFEERCLFLSRRQTPRRSCFGERTIDHAVFQFLLLCPAPCVILMPSFEPDISKVTVHLRCCRADGPLLVASLLTVWHFCLCWAFSVTSPPSAFWHFWTSFLFYHPLCFCAFMTHTPFPTNPLSL